MKTINKIGISLLFLSLSLALNAQTKEIRQGNRNFRNGNYSEAEKYYKNSLDKKYNDKAQFNLGDVYYQQNNFEEASRSFQSVADRNVPKNLEANSYYNLGNSLMEQHKYAEAFDAYKKSLMINPDDEDARYNLEYARQKMIMQQQEQQNQQNNQNNEDNKEKNEEEQQNQQNNQQNNDEQEQQQNQQQNQQEQQMSKEDAERMLQALENQERETMDKMNEAKAAKMQKRKIQKDW